MTHLPTPNELLDAMTTEKDSTPETAGAPGTISGTVDARAFTAKLRYLVKHSERYTSIPILNCCAIEFEPLGVRMKLSHYGIDMTMQATLSAEGSGAVVIPMRSLLAFVSAADGDTLSMEKKPDDSAVTFTCGRFTLHLVPLPIEDVPRLKTPDVFARGFALGEGVLSHLLALTIPFVSTEETRYYLNGVAFECHENSVRVVATDGHKLGTRTAGTPAPLEAWKYTPIVPRIAVEAIASTIGKAQVTMRLHAEFEDEQKRADGTIKRHAGWTRQSGQFDGNDWCITTKLIDGTFPDWRRVIPKPPVDAVTATVKASDVSRFARMLKGMGSQRAVKVEPMEGAGIRLSARNIDVVGMNDGSIFGEVAAEVDGTFQPFGVNAFYFSTIAKALGTERFEMTITGPGDQFLLRPAGARSDDEFAVLMPMRV